MLETLQSLGAEPDVFIPDRFTDGYGPNAEVYAYLQKPVRNWSLQSITGLQGQTSLILPKQPAWTLWLRITMNCPKRFRMP